MSLRPILALALAAAAPPPPATPAPTPPAAGSLSPQQAQRDRDMSDGRICGLDARRNEKLLAKVRAKPSAKVLQDDKVAVQLLDLEMGVVWAFSVKGGPAYPAVSCNELGPYNGHLVFRQSMLCNGASETDCAAFYLMNRQRNERMAAEIEAQQAHERQ